MKKLVTAGAVLALLAGIGVTGAKADPSGYCGGGVVATTGTTTSVCVTEGPVQGSGTVSYQGGTGGYVVADGDQANQSIPGNCLDGYIGVQAGGGHDGPVSSSNGDYAYGAQPAPAAPSVPPCT